MPIISVELVAQKVYRLALSIDNSCTENIVISDNGIYSIYYRKNAKPENRTGKIINIIHNKETTRDSYLVFDSSSDNRNIRERIYFYQIQYIKDITPNNAYIIAVEHGFIGTIDDWLTSLKGDPGLSAYEVAVINGFKGTEQEWLESLKGETGFSAYELAKKNGFKGTEQEWLLFIGDNTAIKEAVTWIDNMESQIKPDSK